MKRLIMSAGVLAAGSAVVHAQTPGLLAPGEGRKPWTVGAATRLFYDDNILLAPKGGYTDGTNVVGLPEDSFGFEFAPRLKVYRAVDNDFFQAAYDLSLKYYFDRDGEKTDTTHQFSTLWDHRFSERYRVRFDDSLLRSDTPQVQNGTFVARSLAAYWNNHLKGNFEANVTETTGIAVIYENQWYDYEQEGDGSYSAILDRVEQDFDLRGVWFRSEISSVSVGYAFAPANYTSENVIRSNVVFTAVPPVPPATNTTFVPTGTNVLRGVDRNYQSHRLYAQLNQKLQERMDLTASAGGIYTTYELSDSTISPYLDVSLSYEYQPESRVTLGLRHELAATDNLGTGSDVTQNQFVTVGSLNISHKLTPKLTGNLATFVQHGVFNGGSDDGSVDNFYVWSLTFDYRFHEHLYAELGYSWNRLESDVPDRSYSQNRVYVGVRATY